MSNLLQYSDIATTLGRLGLSDDPAGFHGVLCGALCRMPPAQIDPIQWLEEQADSVDVADSAANHSDDDDDASLMDDRDERGAAAPGFRPAAREVLVGGLPLADSARAALRGLLVEFHDVLGDVDMTFQPLLPDDTAALAVRAQALGAWCAGFLFGLAGRAHLDLDRCSEEVREIVNDFTQFTRAMYAEQDDLEVEEGAYAELVEYVRISAQLVYMELHPREIVSEEVSRYTLH